MNKQLKRSKNGMIAGVMQGIAETYGWDPTIVRVIYILLSVATAGFPGTLIYLILWFVIPLED